LKEEQESTIFFIFAQRALAASSQRRIQPQACKQSAPSFVNGEENRPRPLPLPKPSCKGFGAAWEGGKRCKKTPMVVQEAPAEPHESWLPPLPAWRGLCWGLRWMPVPVPCHPVGACRRGAAAPRGAWRWRQRRLWPCKAARSGLLLDPIGENYLQILLGANATISTLG